MNAARPQLICLFDKANLLSSADLWRLTFALEENARHCAEHWGLPAPAVVFCRHESNLLPGAAPIVFVTGDDGDPGALAVHYWDPTRGAPAGRVYVDRGSGTLTGSYSICEAAAHEVVETLVNPRLRRWLPHPSPERAEAGIQCAVEVADACQDTYEIAVDQPGAEGLYPVANFVLPAWYRPTGEPGERFDFAGHLSAPGQIGPEGYAIVRGPRLGGGADIWLEDGSGGRFLSAPARGRTAHAARSPIAGRTQMILSGKER